MDCSPQLSSSVNLSRNYPLLFQIFHRSSHLLSLCNFFIQSCQSPISIGLHHCPLIPKHSRFSWMTSVLLSPLLQPLPMNLLSLVTLTFISIILQILLPLSFYLFSLLSILVNMSTALRPYAWRKSHSWSSHNLFRHVTCSGCFLLHPTTFLSPPDCL